MFRWLNSDLQISVFVTNLFMSNQWRLIDDWLLIQLNYKKPYSQVTPIKDKNQKDKKNQVIFPLFTPVVHRNKKNSIDTSLACQQGTFSNR